MRGANSQAAAGFDGADEKTERAAERSTPQQMKPTPMERTSVGLVEIGDDLRMDEASLSQGESLVISVPIPRNPRPPARDTSIARGGVAMSRIGAEATKGLVDHG